MGLGLDEELGLNEELREVSDKTGAPISGGLPFEPTAAELREEMTRDEFGNLINEDERIIQEAEKAVAEEASINETSPYVDPTSPPGPDYDQFIDTPDYGTPGDWATGRTMGADRELDREFGPDAAAPETAARGTRDAEAIRGAELETQDRIDPLDKDAQSAGYDSREEQEWDEYYRELDRQIADGELTPVSPEDMVDIVPPPDFYDGLEPEVEPDEPISQAEYDEIMAALNSMTARLEDEYDLY